MKGANRALLVTAIAGATCCASATAAPPRVAHLHYTHSVTVSGSFVDSWTRSATQDCGFQGSGSTTVTFAWTKAWKVVPALDPPKGSGGRWVLEIDAGDRLHPRAAPAFLITDLPARPLTASYAYVDNATQVGTDCGPPVGNPCANVTKTVKGNLFGQTRHTLDFDATFQLPVLEGACTTGTVTNWYAPFVKHDELLVPMPSARMLARRRTVVLHASDSGHQSSDNGDSTVNETLTRSVTVTFRSL